MNLPASSKLDGGPAVVAQGEVSAAAAEEEPVGKNAVTETNSAVTKVRREGKGNRSLLKEGEVQIVATKEAEEEATQEVNPEKDVGKEEPEEGTTNAKAKRKSVDPSGRQKRPVGDDGATLSAKKRRKP